ncbi:MAG: sigma-70 family RNA polymerase sigma factor [Oscillospiraceae bacterium]|nr:sigma-70 family RNA polymerase sigma factor [Oscillospiraceae bacterium]
MEDFEEIYRRCAVPVKKYVMTLCRNESLAEDVTADTFCKALRHIDSFDPNTRVLTWLCAIAKNTYLDYIRRREYQNLPLTPEMEPPTPPENGPEEECQRRQGQLDLYRNIQKLGSGYRDVLYLRAFAGLSFREIGDVLGKSENWARVTFYRGKNQLKGMMKDEV